MQQPQPCPRQSKVQHFLRSEAPAEGCTCSLKVDEKELSGEGLCLMITEPFIAAYPCTLRFSRSHMCLQVMFSDIDDNLWPSGVNLGW